jgi:hypothetical protein
MLVIGVFESHNILFTQIVSDLYFDQLEIDLAGIGHAVSASDRQVDRFILMHIVDFALVRNFSMIATGAPATYPACRVEARDDRLGATTLE